ncbi:MAG: DUF2157 domain-containing protein [Clostridiaceae bacterium]
MRNISSNKYRILKEELDFWKDNNYMTEDQYKDIISLYSIRKGLSFMSILLLVGAVLVGLGILTFVGSNWEYLSKLQKFIIILLTFVVFNGVSYKLYNIYPKTSKSFMYIAIITFGSGIFLIGQMFNLGGDFETALLLWSLGIIPYALFFRDRIILIFSSILMVLYINQYLSENKFSLILLFVIPVFYYVGSYFNLDKLVLFLNNILVLGTLLMALNKYINNSTVSIAAFFIIGITMYYRKISFQKTVFKFQGNLIYGISGILLTFPSNWEGIGMLSGYNTKVVSIIFTVLFLLFLLLQTRNKNLLSLPIIFIVIMRYYFDNLYNFMPKSLFFIIGGLILLVFGYYFERFRNESRGE